MELIAICDLKLTRHNSMIFVSAFAKLSAAVQVKNSLLGRVEVKGFRKENE